MKQPFEEKNLRKLRILVAPLDWGLGHATRCIPIIQHLLKAGVEVWLAGEGAQEKLLTDEFSDLPFLSLHGYRIRYARSAIGLLKNILFQAPKILKAIRNENKWLAKMIDEHHFDAVISDNRYGLYHQTTPCVFITHQLKIKSPLGKWTEKILQKRNYKYINQFTECWVPDILDEDGLAGELSHPLKKPVIPMCYVGWLSRLNTDPANIIEETKDHLLIILSGPEPQRSLLEDKIIKEIASYRGTATIVRGLPTSPSLIPSTSMIRFYNHLPAEELNKEMQKAEYIISRSGYSTIMDIIKLKKKGILIPTPGQTEQEYLADHLSQKQIVVCLNQKDFSIAEGLQKARQFPYTFPEYNDEKLLDKAMMNLITSIKKN